MNVGTKRLLDFVRSISEPGSRRMEEEKITPDLVHLMNDEELTQYLPLHGDRLRLRKHLKEGDKKQAKKGTLLKLLHDKIEKARNRRSKGYSSSEEEEDVMRRQYGNKNALKGTRAIEVGWIHKTNQRTKQVRSKTGGGTRKLHMPKNATKNDILQEAKRLFFPNGMSTKGKLSDLECDIWDFSERELREDVTIQRMYDETKMPNLRFYLATWEKRTSGNHTVEPSSNFNPRMETASIQHNTRVTEHTNADPLEASASTHNSTSIARSSPDVSHTASSPFEELPGDILSNAIQVSGIGPEDLDTEDFYMDPAIESATPRVPEQNRNVIKVHRGHVLKDIINKFKTVNLHTDNITFEMIMPNGTVEIAEDGGGVTRDTLTEFWGEFYEKCTLGTRQKVPFLRHDFGEDEWKAIGKVICFGWSAQGYFPLELSRPFMEQCLFGNYKSDLLASFYEVIPEHEGRCLQTAVSDFANVDREELLDILDSHEVRNLPDQSNIVRLVQEVAHKELIQAPMFVADCWYDLLKQLFIEEDQLSSMYSELTPTPRAVCKALIFPENMTADQTTVSHHLKRFVRELDMQHLRKFLRYCTGSDLLLKKSISVAFVDVIGLARRPVAHTCSCMLELSKNYDSYPQFRAEFIAVLESSIWVMDMI